MRSVQYHHWEFQLLAFVCGALALLFYLSPDDTPCKLSVILLSMLSSAHPVLNMFNCSVSGIT